MAVASAGPYANNLHLAPDRQPHQHLITHFYRPDALPDAQPTVTKHAKVFRKSTLELERRTCLGVYVPLRGPKIAGRWVPGCHEASAAQAWCPTAPHRQCGHHARSDETAHWLPLDWILMMASLTTNHSRNHDYDLAKIKICRHKHTQPFNGPLSGTTRVGRYQKKHSPTHTHHDHQTSFINFLHLPRSTVSFFFNLRAWHSFMTTSLQVLFGLPLGLGPSTSYSIHFFTQWSS